MNHTDEEAEAAGSGVAKAAAEKVVNLALQGGGSHGAFTWGVLDRLLEEERLSFEGVTAASAGAINAVMLTDGWAAGGRDGAKKALRLFWQKISEVASRGIFQPSMVDRMNQGFGLEHSPGFLFMDVLSLFTSPYLMNPLNYNPLRDVLEEVVDFERVRRQRAVKLFLCATNVRTAKVKVFTGAEIGCDHVIASTCLPLLMHAVEIDGEHYWDGAFAGNPAVFPVIYECKARDIIMVHVTPTERREIPIASHAIMNRMQEISFNSSLIKEMRTIAFVIKQIEAGKFTGGKHVLIHAIEGDDAVRGLSGTSKLNGAWELLSLLHQTGRDYAERWLTANFDRIGVESTVDLEAKYF